MTYRIALLAPENGVGLSRDKQILRIALERLGYTVLCPKHPENPVECDVAIHLELVYRSWLKMKVKNIFFPNPEWFMREWNTSIRSFHVIACKTKDTESIYKKYGNSFYTGFTSFDRYLPQVPKKNAFVHLQGRSIAKGTVQLLDAMKPIEDIELTIYTQREKKMQYPGAIGKNVYYITKTYTDYHYQRIQNEFRIHLCPSIYEGFGHYINEALSCKAVVITTEAEPMAEVAGPKRFGAIPYKIAPWNMAMSKTPAPASLTELIRLVKSLPAETLEMLGEENRKIFLQRDKDFNTNIKALIESL